MSGNYILIPSLPVPCLSTGQYSVPERYQHAVHWWATGCHSSGELESAQAHRSRGPYAGGSAPCFVRVHHKQHLNNREQIITLLFDYKHCRNIFASHYFQ